MNRLKYTSTYPDPDLLEQDWENTASLADLIKQFQRPLETSQLLSEATKKDKVWPRRLPAGQITSQASSDFDFSLTFQHPTLSDGGSDPAVKTVMETSVVVSNGPTCCIR